MRSARRPREGLLAANRGLGRRGNGSCAGLLESTVRAVKLCADFGIFELDCAERAKAVVERNIAGDAGLAGGQGDAAGILKSPFTTNQLAHFRLIQNHAASCSKSIV